MLDVVDHLHALPDRRAGGGVVGEPDALHRRDRDDPLGLARRSWPCRPSAAARRRTTTGSTTSCCCHHFICPGVQVDRDQRVGARVGPGPERRVVRRRRRAGADVERVGRRVDRRRRPDDAAADDPGGLAPLGVVRRDRPERVRPRRRQARRVVGHHEAARAVFGAGGADDQLVVGADRRARLGVAVVRLTRRARRREIGTRASCLPVAGSSATIVMSSVSRKTRLSQYRDAAVRDDAEVLEGGDVVGRVVPEQVARSPR